VAEPWSKSKMAHPNLPVKPRCVVFLGLPLSLSLRLMDYYRAPHVDCPQGSRNKAITFSIRLTMEQNDPANKQNIQTMPSNVSFARELHLNKSTITRHIARVENNPIGITPTNHNRPKLDRNNISDSNTSSPNHCGTLGCL